MTPKPLSLSPSQIDSYLDCPRKWYLKHLLKLPEPPRKSTTLGDVGHAVIERFLKGVPELYPIGWERAKNRWTGLPEGDPLSPDEQSIVKALVHNGIQNGTLVREPDGQVEKEITLSPSEVPVKVRMFLDYATQHAVVDHKFCGSTRYYGPEKLKAAIPMNLYGAARYLTGEIDTPTTWLRYNLFVKDPASLTVKPVEVERTREELLAFYQGTVLPACKRMLLLYERAVPEADALQVSGPDCQQTCSAYGGCPFQSVCTGQKSIAQYRSSFSSAGAGERKEKQQQALAKLQGNSGGTNMDFRERLKAMKAQGQAGQAAPAAAPAQEQAAAEAAPAAVTTAIKETAAKGPAGVPPATAPSGNGQKAPWYMEGCKACSANPVPGFNSIGKPCTICGVMAGKNGKKKPDAYRISVGKDGGIVVSLDGEVLLDTRAPEVRAAAEVVKPVEKAAEANPPLPVVPELLDPTEEREEISGGGGIVAEPEATGTPFVDRVVGVQETSLPVGHAASEKDFFPKEEAPAEPPKRKRRTAAEIKADAEAELLKKLADQGLVQQPAEAAAPVCPVTGEPTLPAGHPDDDKDSDLGEPRMQRFAFTLSYAPVRQRGRVSRILGDVSCVVHIGELLELVHAQVVEAEGGKEYMEINTFRRRDIITQNAETIAEALGASVVDASCCLRGTDEAHLASVIERYATLVMGAMA
jgi:hypothetical protein